jgi:D-alanine-D-alanine ligase
MDEIISAFRGFGFYVEAFFDEIDFIKTVVERGLETIPRKRKLVYNTSQKGTGAARHSLIPAFCKLYNVEYIGANGYVSSLCRHKYHFNTLLNKHHTNLPDAWLYEPNTKWLLSKRPPEGLKVIFKPIYEAASVGVSNSSIFVYSENKDSLLEAHSKTFMQPIVVEEFIEGYEVEVPLMISNGNFYGLGPIGISLKGNKYLGNEILGYETVYDDKFSFYSFNELGEQTKQEILICACESARILEIEDFGRIDFRVTRNGKYYLTDITTNPHIIKHSSCYFAFNEMGFSHSELLASLAGLAGKRHGWI